MNESLNRKLKSILEQAGISVNSSDISILNKKSYKFLIVIKKELQKIGYLIDDFETINKVWKINILLSRIVFKYSNFAENYLLALIVNCLVLDKPQFIEIIKSTLSKLESEKQTKKVKEKVMTMNKCLKKIGEIGNFKFVEKCTIYNYIFQSREFNILIVEPTIFSKIRTLRNKAVHSNFIINYFLNDSENKNANSLYKLIDQKYKEEIKEDVKALFEKYNLNFKITDFK